MSSHGLVDRPLAVARGAPDDGEVGFPYTALGKRGGESGVHAIVLGHDDAATGLLVETMDDAGTVLLRSAGKRTGVMKQGIHQGALLMTCAEVDDHSGRLVHDEKIGILMQDAERDFLRAGSCKGLGSLLLDTQHVSFADFLTASGAGSVKTDTARFDKGLDFRAGESRQMSDQDHVKALAPILRTCGKFVNGGMGHEKGVRLLEGWGGERLGSTDVVSASR
jgi:hypothetical protein